MSALRRKDGQFIVCLVAAMRTKAKAGENLKIERRILIEKKKVFVIIQPDHFRKEYIENTQKIDRIIVMDLRGKILLDDGFNCDTYLYIRKLIWDNKVEIITYNGSLLWSMIWKFWNIECDKIKDLMEEFSVIYGETKEWYSEFGENLYVWQKLSTALKYYGVKNNNIDIYNPLEVLKKTLTLYRKMYGQRGNDKSEV